MFDFHVFGVKKKHVKYFYIKTVQAGKRRIPTACKQQICENMCK